MRDFSRFFRRPTLAAQRQYEALRAFYVERRPARTVAEDFGYTYHAFNSLRRDFARDPRGEKYFIVRDRKPWSRSRGKMARVRGRVIELRKKFWSVYDVREQLRREGHALNVSSIFRILRAAGFGRLPRRLEEERRLGPSRKGGR